MSDPYEILREMSGPQFKAIRHYLQRAGVRVEFVSPEQAPAAHALDLIQLCQQRQDGPALIDAAIQTVLGAPTRVHPPPKVSPPTPSPPPSPPAATAGPTSNANPTPASAPATETTPEAHEAMAQPIRVLHLSDFHFSRARQWDQDPVLRGLVAEVRALVQADRPLDLIAVTGDIAYAGTAEEYTLAAAWFTHHLLPNASCTPAHLRIVPGNHDVDLSTLRRGVKSLQRDLLKTQTQDVIAEVLGDDRDREMMLARHKAYIDFLNELGVAGRRDHVLPWWSEALTIRGVRVHLSGLNSAWMSSGGEDQGRLLLGRCQTWAVLPEPDAVDLSLALMHHPTSYLAEWDATVVEEDLRRRAGVLLRGHLHDQKVRQMADPDRTFLELAAGAAYGGGQWANAFQLLELDPLAGEARIHFRLWDGHGWIPDRNRYQRAPDGIARVPLRRAPRPFGPTPTDEETADSAEGEPAPGPPPPPDPLRSWQSWLRSVHTHLIPFFHKTPQAVLDTVYVELTLETRGLVRVERRALPGDSKRGLKAVSWHGTPAPMTLRSLLEAQPTDVPATALDLLEAQPKPGDEPPAEGVEYRLVTLEQDGQASPPVTGRWLIVGDPGAGKTTAARHLAWTLAGEPSGPVPVYLSLARWAASGQHPFVLAEADLRSSAAGAEADGLAARLTALAREPGRVWLLLDGLDEVHPKYAERARKNLHALAGTPACAGLVLAVFSRPAVVEAQDLGVRFRTARVRPLTDTQQQTLLGKLVPDDAERIGAEIAGRPALAALAANPLMLSLMAMLGRTESASRVPLPVNRVRLYDRAVDLLLKRGHYPEARGVEAPGDARDLLAPLSYELQDAGGESWARKAINRKLRRLVGGDADLAEALKDSWPNRAAFLTDIERNSGILGPHDGPREPWRYLHRSLREFLAAEHLVGLGEATIVARRTDAWRQIREQHEGAPGKARESIAQHAGHWGEVHALACGLLQEPLGLLEALRAATPELVRRALPSVETLPLAVMLDLLLRTEGWDDEDLWAVAQSRPLSGARRAALLLEAVSEGLSTDQLAWMYFTMERLGHPPDRAAFFRACGRWPETDPAHRFQTARVRTGEVPLWVDVPAGTFEMGSPEDEAGRDDDEVLHTVTLTRPFEMMVVPVTCAMYAAFDPHHKSRSFKGQGVSAEGQQTHPVQGVSWWSAWLFSRWLDADLPTEAQWEYACRAGSTAAFHDGMGPPAAPATAGGGPSGRERALSSNSLDEVGWYSENSGGQTHPVGQKLPNAWGLYDLHGNVWEWCQDWYGDYETQPQEDPTGPPRGGLRVIRGGAWGGDAQWCRAADRDRYQPANRSDYLGFRVVRSPPPAGS